MDILEEDSLSNIATVILRGMELNNFPKLMEFCEVNNVSKGKGVFKGRLQPEEVRVTSVEELLEKLKISMVKNKFTPDVQSFECCSEEENIFVYCSSRTPKGSSLAHDFMNTIEDPTCFLDHQVTCCSKSLETGGVEELLNHMWSNVRKLSVPAKNCSKLIMAHHNEEICKIGKELRDKYNFSRIASMESGEEVVGEPPCGELCPHRPICSCDNSNLEIRLKKMMETNPAFEKAKIRFPKNCKQKVHQKRIVYGAGIPIESEHCVYITKDFTLSKLRTILDLYPEKYLGVHYPMGYIGLLHTVSPWHVEDGSLHSISFNHFGAFKVWIVIPPKFKSRFINCLRKSNLPLAHTCCQNILGHKVTMVDTDFLKKNGIPYSVVIQNPGEFVFLEPDAAHMVFNGGASIAEAVNFASESWITHGIHADRCDCMVSQVHIDMLPFIAAFKPELIDSHIRGQHFAPDISSVQKVQDTCEVDASSSKEGKGHNVINTSNAESENVNEEEEESNTSISRNSSCGPKPIRFKMKRIVLHCPVCSETYEGGRGKLKRLLQHAEVKHPFVLDVKQTILDKYKKKPAKMPKKFECDICGMLFAGGPANVRRHKKSKHSQ